MITIPISVSRWMKVSAAVILPCVATMALGGCSSAPKPQPRVLSASIPGAEGDSAVSVVNGQKLSVRLLVDAADGFAWRMPPSAESSGLVALDERRIEQDGELTWQVFTFHTRHTGSGAIRFLCDRPTDTEPTPADKRFTLNVEVMERGPSSAAQVADASAAQ